MPDSLIFDIKRYAINDGPGIRVAVFFKGCNLHCAWCHNPESISPKAEKMFAPAKCIRCGSCVAACPEKAITLTDAGIVTDPALCKACGNCAEVCPTMAIEMSGRAMTADEVMNIIEGERIFIEQSGGGVTFSGGEPLTHIGMLTELLDACGRAGIHRAVDTAGNVATNILLETAKRTDLFLYDLKTMDPAVHRRWTGASNGLILNNLQLLAQTGAHIIIRIPLIGGINDSEKNMTETAEFAASLEGEKKEVHLLPYHAIAEHKYMKLSRAGSFQKFEEPPKEALQKALAIFSAFGIKAGIGG